MVVSHKSFGPGVADVLKKTADEFSNLDLSEVEPGDIVYVKMGDQPEDLLKFTIISPAKNNCERPTDYAYAWLPGPQWSSDCTNKRVKVAIGGSCTYNQGAPFNMSMLAKGMLTKGREFIIWLGDSRVCKIHTKPIQDIMVEKAKS